MRTFLLVLVDGYLPAAVADAGISIVDAAELSWGDALDGFVAMDVVTLFVEADEARHEVVHMAYLELAVNRVAIAYVPDVLGEILVAGQV